MILVTEMLLAVLSVCSQEELDDSDSDSDSATREPGRSPADVQARRQQIRNKIMAVGRMQRVFQLLRCVLLSILSSASDVCQYREEAEMATELVPTDAAGGATAVGSRTGTDALGVQGTAIGRSIRTFADA